MTFIANSKQQPLALHCLLVAKTAYAIIKKSYSGCPEEEKPVIESMANQAYLAGLFHDIGKLDPNFQRYIKSLSINSVTEEDGEHIISSFERKKADRQVQEPFSFEKYPRHEEVSWVLIDLFLNNQILKQVLADQQSAIKRNAVKYAVYWHHAKPLRTNEEDFKTQEKIRIKLEPWIQSLAINDLRSFFAEVFTVENKFSFDINSFVVENDYQNQLTTPAFKEHYSNKDSISNNRANAIKEEAYKSAVRSAVVTADRLVSVLDNDILLNYITSDTTPSFLNKDENLEILYSQINKVSERFELLAQENNGNAHRNAEQKKAVIDLKEASETHSIVCLQGPAGCGKTKIFLEYLHTQEKRQIFVFVPRTAIGAGLFKEFTKEYGLNEKIELKTGSDTKYSINGDELDSTTITDELAFTGNVVITTIDQICKVMLSHKKIDLLTQLASAHLVFDEFHELYEIPAIVLLFLELMELRKYSLSKTLLVSATPNYQLLNIIGVPASATIKIDSFMTEPIHVQLKELPATTYSAEEIHFFSKLEEIKEGDFLVANTAIAAQEAAISHFKKGKDIICFHSKFNSKHRRNILSQVFKYWGKSADFSRNILISGPIVQASLNVSTSHLHTEACHSENMLQRLGRVNRFGGRTDSQMTVYYAFKNKELANRRDLNNFNSFYRTQGWINFLIENGFGDEIKSVTIKEMYELYDLWHMSCADAYIADFNKILEASVKIFSKNDFDPIQFPAFISKSKNINKLSKTSLRGSSFYVLPSVRQYDQTGKQIAKSLLWTNTDDKDCWLTSDLKFLAWDDSYAEKYKDWSQSCFKKMGTTRNEKIKIFLEYIQSATTKIPNKFSVLKNLALSPNTPLVCTGWKDNPTDPAELQYVIYTRGETEMKVGLMLTKDYLEIK